MRLKANNVPTAHVHILSGSAAFPQSIAIFLGGKGFSYTRAGRLLCVAVTHVELYEQFNVKGAARHEVFPPESAERPVAEMSGVETSHVLCRLTILQTWQQM